MRFTISGKLFLSFASILILTATAGYFSVSSLHKENETLETFARRPFVQVQAIQSIDTEVMNVRRNILRTITTTDGDVLKKLKENYDASWAAINANLESFRQSVVGREQDEVRDFEGLLAAFRQTADEGRKLAAAADPELENRALETTDKAFHALLTKIAAIGSTSTAANLNTVGNAVASLEIAAYGSRLAMISAVDLNDPAQINAMSEKFDKLNRTFEENLTFLSSKPEVPFEILKELREEWSVLAADMRGFTNLGIDNTTANANRFVDASLIPAGEKIGSRINDLVERAQKVAQNFLTESSIAYFSIRNTLLAIVFGAVVSGAAAAFWMSRTISRGLRRSVDFAETIGSGNLTQTIAAYSNDELGDLQRTMNAMSEKLRETVFHVAESSNQVSSGSQQSSTVAEQLSQGATEQAAATQQASAAMEEMSTNIRQTADNATTSERIAAQASVHAERSAKAVVSTVLAMRTIAERITVVQEIARQTDLLALNAAIEAARAGNHGKGFAVVASEVRKLAERSQRAANEIGQLSTSTLDVSEEAGRMLEQLVPNIQRTNELVGEISAACREQSAGAQQINQAIQQLDQITQQNAAAANEMSATAEQLSTEAQRLTERASYFRLEQGSNEPLGTTTRQQTVRALQTRENEFGEKYAAHPSTKLYSTPHGLDLRLDEPFDRLSA